MERRVIKFNLMGAIFVLLLIIAAIVGIIVFAINASNGKIRDKKIKEDIQEQQEAQKNDQMEVREKIIVGNEQKEITMRTHISKLKYRMNYDVDSFYIIDDDSSIDRYSSQYTDAIYLNVTKSTDPFVNKVNELITISGKNKTEDPSYKLSELNINGKLCYVERAPKDKEIFINYYIEANEGFYIIETHCGEELQEVTLATIEKMIMSFEEM